MLKFKIGVTEAYAQIIYGYTPSINELIEYMKWVANSGFRGFELTAITREHFYSDFTNKEKIKMLKDSYKSLGLELNAFEVFFCKSMMVDANKDVRKKAIKDFEKAVDTCLKLDTKLIYTLSSAPSEWKVEFEPETYGTAPPSKVYIPSDFSWKVAWEQYTEVVSKLADIAQEAGIRFALEIRPYEIVSNSDSMLRLITAVRSRSFGVVLDTGHLFVQKEILPVTIEKLWEKIFLVHLSDNDGCVDYHWPPGKGKIDWESVLKALKKTDYAGYLNIDVAGEYKDLSDEIREGKKYVEDILKKLGARY